MSSQKASFYAKDTGRFLFDVIAPKKKKYSGLEKRMENRRKGSDRRVDIRFNLTKPDRRTCEGRRAEDALPKFW